MADALQFAQWRMTWAESLRPAPGSAGFEGLFDCSNMTFVAESMGGNGGKIPYLIHLESLRRASRSPLPHSLERWPEPSPPPVPPPPPSDLVLLGFAPAIHQGGGKELELTVILDSSVDLAGINLVLGAAGLDIRPPAVSTPAGPAATSTEYYLITGGRLVFRSSLFQPQVLPAGLTVLELRAELPRGSKPGDYQLDWLEGTEVVSTSGEAIRPTAEPGLLRVLDPVEAGPRLPFPPFQFADREARRMGGKTELRVTGDWGYVGQEVNVRVQLRTDIPLDSVPFFLKFDGSALSLLEAVPVYRDPEEGRVRMEDYLLFPRNARPPDDRFGRLEFRYFLSPDHRPYHDPWIFGNGQPTLKYLVPLGEWIDLVEVRFLIREGAARHGSTPLELSSFPIPPEVPSYLLFPEAQYLWGGDHRCEELAAWWEYETEYIAGEIEVLGGGEPREPDPPLGTEAAGIRFAIGGAGGKPGDQVRLGVSVESLVPLYALRHALRFDPSRLELVGFEVNYLDPDWNQRVNLLTPELWFFINPPSCEDPDGDGIPNPCSGGQPHFAILYGEKRGDEVPEGSLIVDIRKLRNFQFGPPATRWWEPGFRHEIGALVFRIREEAPPGITGVFGDEVEWRNFDLIGPVRSVSSGYPFLWGVDLDRLPRSDVPAVEVLAGAVDIGGVVFLRGDADGDGVLRINDPIRILHSLFLGEQPLDCDDAADGNDDGRVDVTDPIFILWYMFLGGQAIPAPYPQEGPDPTADGLGCRRR